MKGKQVAKMPVQDEVATFLERQNDKEWWRKITDDLNNKQVKLSKADLELLQRVRSGKFAEKMDPEEYAIEIDNDHKFIHPFSVNEPKRRFQPSKWERLRVNKMV